MAERFDLVVIGSGPAGEKGAAQTAYFGKRVALVEASDLLGGACANTGTLPSKTLRESALYLSGLRQRDVFGVELTSHVRPISVADFMVQKVAVLAHEHERIARNLAHHQIELVRGRARFIDAETVDVGGRRLMADRFLVATGSRPRRPPEIPFADPDVDDSDEILALPRIPATLIVVGGGVIGCEYASIFAALGLTRVTLIEARDRLVGFIDDEIGERLVAAFGRLGIEVLLSDSIASWDKGAGGHGVRVRLRSGKVLEADRLLAAAGRSGNTDDLGLEALGVLLDERGLISVNEHFQTAVPHIYAAGDVVGFPSLASTSMEQGRVAMCHAFGFSYKTQMTPLFPYGLYTIPEVSMIGDTEAGARKKGLDVEVGRAFYKDNARGQIINDPDGMVKLVFERSTRRLLGAHCLGERATELVHTAQAVLGFGGTIDYFIECVFNYPTLGEIFKYAAYDGLGRLAADRKSA
jgi:NAD(P) transhydrogenase